MMSYDPWRKYPNSIDKVIVSSMAYIELIWF